MADYEQAPSLRTWEASLGRFLPEFVSGHPVLVEFKGQMAVILHGSTTMGIDDPFSDLDLWLLLSAASLTEFDRQSPTRFVSFELNGKKGHLNVTSADAFADRVARCDLDTIYQLRRAAILADDLGVAHRLQQWSRQPMRPEVRDALFFWHYTEMRGEHRACDNPMQRVDATALLFFLTKTMGHALRASMVLDGEPCPYDKWLYRVARQTPTGAQVAPSIDRIMDLLGQGQLRFPGGEASHPIGQELRVVRQTLIDAANARGIHELWLEKWWRFMDQARAAIDNVRW